MKARTSVLNVCSLCKSDDVRLLRIEKNIPIFYCLNCQLGFLDEKGVQIQKSNKKDDLYSLKDYKEQTSRFTKRFQNLANIIKRYKNEGKILDIGAGFGLFSSILNYHKKYEIEVIEPINKPYFLQNLKIKIRKKNIDDFIKTNNKRYDIILLMDVLEHFEDLIKQIKKIKSLLNKRGIIVIQTPNYLSLMAKICFHWSWWMIEDHKFFFSPISIKYLFNKLNMEIVYLNTYEDFYDFKKNLDGNFVSIKNNLLRKSLKFVFFSIFFPVYFILRNLLFNLGYGGLIFAVVKKNEI